MADPTAWLMLAAGDNREHRGNDGYDDAPSERYSWDSTVPNHSRPQPGDVIALWDKRVLLGASVIDDIYEDEVEKPFNRCPHCNSSSFKVRLKKKPAHRCDKCGSLFEEPSTFRDTVTTFRTRHEAAWVDLTGTLTGHELRSLCAQPKAQHSIRQLDFARFKAALDGSASPWNTKILDTALSSPPTSGGHRKAIVRVRVGQGTFRRKLLRDYGQVCAVTGLAPEEALDAAHLYSFAAKGVHHDEGGLLLRRDIHRLFDVGHIAVNPTTLLLHLRTPLLKYDIYKQLHGAPLQVALSGKQIRWIAAHWYMHRT